MGSALKKTMQTMQLEGCLPHVVSIVPFVRKQDREKYQGDTGVDVLSVLLIG